MATAAAVVITGPQGVRLLGGKYPAGTSDVSGAAVLDSPAASGGFSGSDGWQIAEGATVARGRNTTTALRPVAGGEFAYTSPDLLADESLVISAGQVQIVGGPGVPTVDPSSSDPVIAAIATADRTIELLDSPSQHAVAQNMRTGVLYGNGAAGARNKIQYAVEEAVDGDRIEIGPGIVWRPGAGDGSGYLEGAGLAVYKSLTITNKPGRGRWRLAPADVAYVDGMSGIVVWETVQCGGRKTIVIEGFDIDNWGRGGADYGVRMRPGSSTGSWTDIHTSITFRNFKVGKKPYLQSGSGFSGSAENLLFERGEVYDTGGGIGSSDGQEHNWYIGARNLTMLGVIGRRTRANSADGITDMDGHILKTSAVNALIEGCVFVAGPKGDNSATLQFYAGGNAVVRGCLLIGSRNTQDGGTGLVRYEKEATGTPWYFGSEGHSLTFERNLCISHIGKPILFFRPSISSNYIDTSLITLLCRDNIGMVAGTPTGLTPSPFTVDRWITNPDPSWPAWLVNNSQMPYGVNEPGFTDDEKALFLYRRMHGPIAASGSMTTKRFIPPHDWIERTDSARGLG